ncbi:hypothetical protein [Flexivirga aerilata]|uniref:hypothetical protein n=1 Tax=Flexivirga aerilata TaxID=1656889 RepID=UPI001BB29958|nr:hypothetical protein [Flexivirga aerilata]
MASRARKRNNLIVGAGAAFFAAGTAIAIGTAGAASAAPPGNNSTVKIHELDTPDHTESNDPKVCEFNLEYFNQDPSQEGFTAVFTTQPGGEAVLTIPMPPAGADGYSESVYLNADPNGETDGYTVPAGQYYVTVYGKFGTEPEEKAKSKVFRVDCEDTTPTSPTGPTSPTEPTSPTSPTSPTEPTSPTGPTSPTEPTSPTGPTSPTEPTSPTGPTSPTEPTSPTGPTSPTEPTSPTGPTSPTEPTSPTGPTSPTTGPTSPTSPTGPTSPTTGPTAPPTGPTSPTTGPPVVTDGPQGGGGNDAGVIGLGMVAFGVVVAGAGMLRRRMTE